MGATQQESELRQRRADAIEPVKVVEVAKPSYVRVSTERWLLDTQRWLLETQQYLSAYWSDALNLLGLVMWVGGLYLNIGLSIFALVCLVFGGWKLGGSIFLFQGILIALPLKWGPPNWARRLLNFSIKRGVAFFPMKLVLEDGGKDITEGRPYIVGFEPHSALPLAMAGVFSDYSGLLPPALTGMKTLASNALFFVPGLRHLWYWLGMRSVSRRRVASLLRAGSSLALCPGGVAECLHMVHGEEVAYLKRRTGFVRMAMQHGAALLPAFAFGQTESYSWAKPGPPLFSEKAVARLSRAIGFLPLFMMGQRVFGWIPTPLPHQVPMTVVLGRPIEVPREDNPSPELVQKYLQIFIDDMTALVAKHKAAAGYPDMPFTVY